MVVDIDFEVSLLDGLAHHIEVRVVGALQSALLALQFEFIVVEVLNPEVEAIGHLDLALTLVLHRLEIDYVLLLIMNNHCVEEAQLTK